jgi:glucose/arabinose dehydrogenase
MTVWRAGTQLCEPPQKPVQGGTMMKSMVFLSQRFAPSGARATARRSAAAMLVTAAVMAVPTLLFAAPNVPLEDPIPGLIPSSAVTVDLKPVASGLISPVVSALAPGDEDHIYVADQVGKLYRIQVGENRAAGTPTVFLDVSKRLVPLGLFPPLNYDERGLLGVAFHPDFQRNGLLYTFTSEPVAGAADFSTLPPGVAPDCHSVITEWRVAKPGHRNSPVDITTARVLMRIDKPQFNHNGGMLAFGPDKMLYISLGDGGNANDVGPGHAPGGNGQSLAPGNVLGKILRINPLGRNSANGNYGVPQDNPRVGKTGAAEIFAWGFRNPYRMSFDNKMGKLWVGDVGQNDIEEIDVVVKGGNYGWPIKEGTFLFDNNGGATNARGFIYQNSPGVPADLIDPIAEYDHADGVGQPETRVAIIGGFVYRGTKIKGLRGQYVFGDYSGEIGTPANGALYTLGANNRVERLQLFGRTDLGLAVLGWARDHAGELYLLANGSGTLNGVTGVVLKLAKVGGGRDEMDDDKD